MNNSIKFVVPKDKGESEFVGFNSENGAFVFPCKYFRDAELDGKHDEQLFKREAKNILLLLKHVEQKYLFGGGNAQLLQFHSMLWLMQDYIDHGYYVETEKVFGTSGAGRIHWGKTIRHSPVWLSGGNVIYPNPIRSRVTIDESRIITQIYKACLEYSVLRLGFIFGIERTEHAMYDVEKDKDFLSFFLTKELQSTNKDDKKTLLRHLLSIVNHQNEKTSGWGFSIFDKDFEYVFEFLINHVFGTEDVKKFYNTYSYYLPQRVPSSKLRPDTIMKDERSWTYYVVDSKYYNFGYTGSAKDLPASSDISKQIGYNHFLRDNLPEKEQDFHVKSVFLLPYSAEDSQPIKCVGYACRDARADENFCNKKDDDRVAVCLVDLRELIYSYQGKSNTLSPRKLIETIENFDKIAVKND